MTKPTNVELPAKAIENLPPKAAEKLPYIGAPPAPPPVEVHHESWSTLAPADLFFDAETLDFSQSVNNLLPPEFVLSPSNFSGALFETFVDNGVLTYGDDGQPSDGFFNKFPDDGTYTSTATLFEETSNAVTFHTEAGVNVTMTNYNYDSATNTVSFDRLVADLTSNRFNPVADLFEDRAGLHTGDAIDPFVGVDVRWHVLGLKFLHGFDCAAIFTVAAVEHAVDVELCAEYHV
jgi:hypothetical protein